MARFVTFKRGGTPGKVAVNADLVSDVRSSLGPFTDIFMGDHQVTVDGNFEYVVTTLADRRDADPPPSDWIKKATA